MSKLYIDELESDGEATTRLAVREKQLRVARNGKPFLTLKLADKTGTITGRVWDDAARAAEKAVVGGVVQVRGRCERFRDELQLNILEMEPVDPGEIDPSDFLPVCPRNLDELYARFESLASGVKRPALQRLLKRVRSDADLMERFKKAPAAKSMHHAYLGGLLEHSVSVARTAERLYEHFVEQYRDLDRDLLLTGALLHDIGKVREFDYTLCIDYSHAGRLLGHIVLGVEILEDKIRGIKNFPAEEALLLKHLLLSHHGETELGAVKLPLTREAFLLHFADDLDAKMNSLTRILDECASDGDSWTSFQPLFNRFFFRGFGGEGCEALEERGPRSEADEQKDRQLSLWDVAKR